MSRLLLLTMLVAQLTACRSSDPVEEEDAPLPEATFVARYAKTLCGAYAPCCAELGIAGTQLKCNEAVEMRDARSGATIYHENFARECLKQLEASPPSCQWPWAPAVCEKVFRGPKAVLEPCESWGQCAPSDAEGEDTSCSYFYAKAVCQRFRYVADVGEACNGYLNADGTAAEVVVGCKRGLTCWIDNKCHAPSEEGGVCPCGSPFGYDLDCGDGNTCVKADHIHPHWLAVCR